MEMSPLETLYTFISELLERQRHLDEDSHETVSLVYAEALLLRQLLDPTLSEFPKQIVIIGPTQAGKSTLTNLLTGAAVAESSALAGFTRHPQGFSTETLDADLKATVTSLLAGLTPTPPNALSADELKAFALVELPADAQPAYRPAIFWDTPDFDSVSSRNYRFAVPKVCAIADTIVLVVSKEKYADQSVWETLRLLAEVPRPLLVIVNKAPAQTEAALEVAVTNKFAQEGIAQSGILSLPYLEQASFKTLQQTEAAPLLSERLRDNLEQPKEPVSAQLIKRFLQRHWLEWTGPVRLELQARDIWTRMVSETLENARGQYERDYLRNPDYGDTMQQAIVRLLELLELPGIATSLARIRNTLTWPARTLYRNFIKKQPDKNGKFQPKDHETETLQTVIAAGLTHLLRESGDHAVGDQHHQGWWQQLWSTLQEQRPELEHLLIQSIESHQRAFAPQIQLAADKLFAHLQKHPATLNSLRAARVTADAAAVVLALKTGGIGVNDLILTPAMLSFTSMLTEGAVGRYMTQVEAELKKAQLESVQTHVIQPMQARLLRLPEQMNRQTLFGISSNSLEKAEDALGRLA